ncbi:hypothetical protein [Streptomyces ziwulingensis]|uniref:Gamma-butyrolactone-binding regulator SlbR n=1 Tax=Streptomyces ziwulingensis TaxID=1045501 RepID=A0ABP9B616_9ACTN
MSENTAHDTHDVHAAQLSSQYTVQVADDLKRNAAEQERIAREIDGLRRRLAALRHDHTVLLAMRQALGSPAASDSADPDATESAAVPAPRKKATAASRRTTKAKGATGGKAVSRKATSEKATSEKAASEKVTSEKVASEKAGEPAAAERSSAQAPQVAQATRATRATRARFTLIELVRTHLAAAGGPRSAAEVTAALVREHPDRTLKPTVVRTTLEALVAKNQARRAKQGSSVRYTAPAAPESAARAGSRAQSAEGDA